jgi:ABC-type sugar transport system substrate-binding protein
VNSDIADFPTAVHGVVGYHQRGGTFAQGLYLIDLVGGTAKVGVLEGLPGYHSTERIGGFLDAFADQAGMEIVTSLPTAWNVETGNTAMMDLLQARPEVNMVVTANDYIALGAAAAAAALGRTDVIIAGNDGDPAGLEAIAEGPHHVDRQHPAHRDGQGRAAGRRGLLGRRVPRRLGRDAHRDRRPVQHRRLLAVIHALTKVGRQPAPHPIAPRT